jgi:hypothetical protein
MKSLILIISILSFVFYKAETSGLNKRSTQSMLQYTEPESVPWQSQLIAKVTDQKDAAISPASSGSNSHGRLPARLYQQTESNSFFTIFGPLRSPENAIERKRSTQKEAKDSLLLVNKN